MSTGLALVMRRNAQMELVLALYFYVCQLAYALNNHCSLGGHCQVICLQKKIWAVASYNSLVESSLVCDDCIWFGLT
jgi:hypothetical protein